MTKQIKTYTPVGYNMVLNQKSEGDWVKKHDHDDFCKQAQEKTDEDIKLMSDKIISLEKNQKKLVEALKFECGNRCAEQNPCNAKEFLKEIGEL